MEKELLQQFIVPKIIHILYLRLPKDTIMEVYIFMKV